MKCDEIKGLMLDVAAGAGEATPAMNEHLLGCPDCAGKLAGIRQTMALLDEWQAPDPSPYFDTRLAARMREERAQPVRAGWLSWFRAPALAGALALVLMVAGGVGLYNKGKGGSRAGNIEVPQVATAGTAAETATSRLHSVGRLGDRKFRGNSGGKRRGYNDRNDKHVKTRPVRSGSSVNLPSRGP